MRTRLFAVVIALAAMTWVGCNGGAEAPSSDSTASTGQPGETPSADATEPSNTASSADGTETTLVSLDVPNMV